MFQQFLQYPVQTKSNQENKTASLPTSGFIDLGEEIAQPKPNAGVED